MRYALVVTSSRRIMGIIVPLKSVHNLELNDISEIPLLIRSSHTRSLADAVQKYAIRLQHEYTHAGT